MVTRAPAFLSAFTGSVNSDSSKPLVARTATRKSGSLDAMVLLFIFYFGFRIYLSLKWQSARTHFGGRPGHRHSRRTILSRFQIKEGKVRFIIMLFDECCGTGGEKKFQRRPGDGFQQMSAAHLAITKSYRAMRMNLRDAVNHGDIADE